jgi:hypothetical protein
MWGGVNEQGHFYYPSHDLEGVVDTFVTAARR